MMGYNCERAGDWPIMFDIETVGNPAAVSMLGPVHAARNIKDPAKIEAAIAEKERERIERAALDIDTAQIVCIGADFGDGPEVLATHEPSMLAAFWLRVASIRAEHPLARLVGFNCLAYDLPVLIRRSQVLGVRHPSIQLGRYRHEGVLDLMAHLTWDGLVPPKSLTTYCKLFGLDVPADESTGADVAALYAAGKIDAICDHCKADVIKTAALYARLFSDRTE